MSRKRGRRRRKLGRPTTATPAWPLSGPAHATNAKGKPKKILQLNIEGISSAKREILSQLAKEVCADIILLQETHSTKDEQLGIVGFDVIASHHHRQYGLATYVREGVPAEVVGESAVTDEVEWQTIKVDSLTVTNVYKPPSCRWSFPPLPQQPPTAVYCGDFNSHHTSWGYFSCNDDGMRLEEWMSALDLQLLYDPKQPPTFLSGRWSTHSNPDLAFISKSQDDHAQCFRRVLDPFPHSQHRPSLITTQVFLPSTEGLQLPRWNFRKAKWDVFKSLLEESSACATDACSGDVNFVYKEFCSMVVTAAKKSIPRGCRSHYIPCWTAETTKVYNEFKSAPTAQLAREKSDELIDMLDRLRRERWRETVEGIDFTHSSRKAWSTLKRLSGDSSNSKRACPVSANSIASVLVQNGRSKCQDKSFSRSVKADVRNRWKAPSVDTNIYSPFKVEELNDAIRLMEMGKAPGLDSLHNEFFAHMGPVAIGWLLAFLNRCFLECRLPSIWRKAKVVATPKPGKPLDDPKSYRPISLLCVPYKIMERLILGRINDTVESQLPPEQAGFRKGRCTQDQVLKLTQDIEASFEEGDKVGSVLVDLTAAYDTVWHTGLTAKLLHVLPCKPMVKFIMELISNRSFVLHAGGQVSRLRRLKNGLPQGSVLAPILFNIYTYDLPETKAKKYVYADDICLVAKGKQAEEISSLLSSDMDVLQSYFKKWRLILSVTKTVSAYFHLNNRQANQELSVIVDGRRLPFSPLPTYLGVKMDRSLTYHQHLDSLKLKVASRSALIRKLAGSTWGADASTLRISVLALVFAPAEYCAPVWCRSSHTQLVDSELNNAVRVITGCLLNTPVSSLYVMSNIAPPPIRREALALKSAWKALSDESSLLHEMIATPAKVYRQLQAPTRTSARLNLAPRKVVEQRLTSRHPFQRAAQNLLSSVGGNCPETANQRKSGADHYVLDKWRRDWRVDNAWKDYYQEPDIVPLRDLPSRLAWSRLNRLITGRTRLAADMYRCGLADSPACDCGAPFQTPQHIVEECPFRFLDGGFRKLASLDNDALSWLKNLDVDI